MSDSRSGAKSDDLLLPDAALRLLGDRSYDKRKTGALSVEEIIKSHLVQQKHEKIHAIVKLLGDKYTRSNNQIHRKGGLIGLAATAIGLANQIDPFLKNLLEPVTQCFSDPEPRVRYYACESLFNIAKVARQSILKQSFNEIFAGYDANPPFFLPSSFFSSEAIDDSSAVLSVICA